MHISVDIINNPDSTDPIIIKPYKFDISQFGEKERNTLEFTIRNISNTDLELKLVDMPAKMFKLILPRKIRAGGTEKGKIIVQKGFVSQEFEKSLTIELNDKLLTRFTVPVKRIIRIPGTADTTKTKK
ncbi:MAG: hypothetical protein NTV06_06890 [candidate division Zixibacteria bacterium]|nr:hypothetical protein [candidate division Zixibacteria bacterium]